MLGVAEMCEEDSAESIDLVDFEVSFESKGSLIGWIFKAEL